jgi:molybdenum cofactor synthesis domain-containing protein
MTESTTARSRDVTACVIVIGNEILSGRTADANVRMIGGGLAAVGVHLREARVVADDPDAIIEAINACRSRFDYVFTTGGIGPTHDDITAACVARAFGTEVERDAEAVRRLRTHYGEGDLNAARLKMADIPRGATLIDNPVSQAPGFRIGNVFVLAGVPRIAQAMFDTVKHGLKGGRPVLSRSVVGYLGESDLAASLSAIQDRFADVELGSYPFVRNNRIGVSIVARGVERGRVDAACAAVAEAMRALGASPEDEESAVASDF